MHMLSFFHSHVEMTFTVVYFADDDNAYDHRLFEDLRTIKTVGIFPSAFSGGANYEACVLDWRGKITSFATNFPGREGVGERKFKVDMGGFAINIDMLKRQPEWRISDLGSGGHMETDMVEAFISSPAEADPVGRCAELRFWHMPKHEKWLIKKLAEVPKGAPKHYDLLASQFPPPPQKILLMTYAFGKEAVSNPFFRMFVESAKYSGVDM
eukprot:Plantae.Rhodophyta-Palmaria_palmata.ctg33080.p1 GENE.Plantae.Rhodophyta-Palmaria_palmata.ctg33080~~Plantae.Rhodophyta-Palmaria_palmata.ctg33080.p1  ORF type:complete len:211 (-),score=28.50 Plantae.Rhodophyta-Palmaria_palmata.ctg33080:226-858(-)